MKLPLGVLFDDRCWIGVARVTPGAQTEVETQDGESTTQSAASTIAGTSRPPWEAGAANR